MLHAPGPLASRSRPPDARGTAAPGIRGAHRLLCTLGQLLLELIKPIMIKPDQISGSREIAQGSFGTIYSAMYNKRRVAVKRINKVVRGASFMMLQQGRGVEAGGANLRRVVRAPVLSGASASAG